MHNTDWTTALPSDGRGGPIQATFTAVDQSCVEALADDCSMVVATPKAWLLGTTFPSLGHCCEHSSGALLPKVLRTSALVKQAAGCVSIP
jgi:hypothetical protein